MKAPVSKRAHRASGCPSPRPLSPREHGRGECERRDRRPQPCDCPSSAGLSSPGSGRAEGAAALLALRSAGLCRRRAPSERSAALPAGLRSRMRGGGPCAALFDLGMPGSPARTWPRTCPTESPGPAELWGASGGPKPARAAGRRCWTPPAPGRVSLGSLGGAPSHLHPNPPQARPERE